jgi:hypothetical protein
VVSLAVLPAMFAAVWIALPARAVLRARWIFAAAAAFALATVLLHQTDHESVANLTKFAGATLAGWWFLTFFEEPWWVLLVGLLIIPVDLYSVAQGPTKVITETQPQVFDALSVFMRIPGTTTAGDPVAAQLGLPDILFFALFLGACAEFGLRVGPTWFAMVASFGGTICLAVWLDHGGVAALPLLSASFVLVNADLLWRSIRDRPKREPEPDDPG